MLKKDKKEKKINLQRSPPAIKFLRLKIVIKVYIRLCHTYILDKYIHAFSNKSLSEIVLLGWLSYWIDLDITVGVQHIVIAAKELHSIK